MGSRSREDKDYWFLKSTGWVEGPSFLADDKFQEPKRPEDCLAVWVFNSPNKMYSKGGWEEVWKTGDGVSLTAAYQKFGRTPRSSS